MFRVAVVLVYSSGLGWGRVAIDEPSDEALRKGETQRAKPSVVNLCTSVDSRVDVKSNHMPLSEVRPRYTWPRHGVQWLSFDPMAPGDGHNMIIPNSGGPERPNLIPGPIEPMALGSQNRSDHASA